MSKLIITAKNSPDMSQTGIVLVNNNTIQSQISHIAPKDGYVQLAPEDLSLIIKLLSIDSTLFTKESEILYSILKRKIGGKLANDSILNILLNGKNDCKHGDYELCLHLLTYVNRDENCRKIIGINGCSMHYHFSDEINFNESIINEIGFYKGHVSDLGRYCRERPWMYACLFQLQNRGDLFNESVLIDKFLAKCVNLSWKLFFSDQVKDSKRPRNYFWKTEYRYSIK